MEALGGGWRKPVVTPEWFTAWFRHYGEHKTPSVVVSRAPGGAVQGIFPLARSLRGRPISLRFAGANLGDHFHPLADDGEGVTLSRLAGAFLEQQPGASTIVLDNVDAAATWWRALAAGFRRPLVTSAYRHSTLPRIDLGDTTWEEFLAARSRNFRSQVRRRERRLEREHGLRFRRTTDAGQVAQDMQTFYRLHDARWRERGGSSLNSPTARAFHTDFAAAALQRGWLRLWFLEADGDDVAAWYGWRLGDRYPTTLPASRRSGRIETSATCCFRTQYEARLRRGRSSRPADGRGGLQVAFCDLPAAGVHGVPHPAASPRAHASRGGAFRLAGREAVARADPPRDTSPRSRTAWGTLTLMSRAPGRLAASGRLRLPSADERRDAGRLGLDRVGMRELEAAPDQGSAQLLVRRDPG